MKKNELLQDAFAEIDESLLADAETARRAPTARRPIAWLAFAASLVLMTCVFAAIFLVGNKNNPSVPIATSENSVATDTPPTSSLPAITSAPQSENSAATDTPAATLPSSGANTPSTSSLPAITSAPQALITYQVPLFDALASPESAAADALAFLKGSSTSVSDGGSDAPPAFEFNFAGLVAKVKVAENLPDTYTRLLPNGTEKPQEYRLIRFETLEVINGSLPESFLYLLPAYLFVDMSVYDSLLISMYRCGEPNFVLRNLSQNKMESFPEQLYWDDYGYPELGNIIAFSNGIFDESLWQTKSWFYGYQFAQRRLEEGDEDYLVVKRGGSEEYTLSRIRQQIKEWEDLLASRYPESPVTPDTDAPENQAELEAVQSYVKPFVNGVFSQDYPHSNLRYRRYVNGFPTDEWIGIDRKNNVTYVTYSESRYTKEDLASMVDLGYLIAEKRKAYEKEFPAPPHTDPEGKELRTLALFGFYVKKGDTVYGIVKTVWIYWQKGESTYYELGYYDDAYTVYDSSSGICRDITRDDLVALVGKCQNIYSGDYTEPFDLAW